MPTLAELERTHGQVTRYVPELTHVGSDEVLRRQCESVDLSEGVEIAERLKATLLKIRQITGVGRGIAAPQIGEDKRVFVTYLNDNWKVFLNPQVVESSKERSLYREQCLSSFMESIDVERPVWVILKWIDESGDSNEQRYEGIEARLIQHEFDHLEGRLNIDVGLQETRQNATNDPLSESLRPVR